MFLSPHTCAREAGADGVSLSRNSTRSSRGSGSEMFLSLLPLGGSGCELFVSPHTATRVGPSAFVALRSAD